MRLVLTWLREFLREEWDPLYFAWLAVVAAISLAVNFTLGLEHSMVRQFAGTFTLFLFYCLFYGIPFVAAAVPYALRRNKQQILRSVGFWGTAAAAIGVLALNGSQHLHVVAVRAFVPFPLQYFVLRCANNLASFLIYFCGAWIVWRVRGRDTERLYGLQLEGVALRPFLSILLLVLPWIIAASFLPDFLQNYPRYVRTDVADHYGLPRFVPALVFEGFYGLDFISTELFFRGFLVLGFVRYLGRGAIFPMMMVYLYLHFEKPLVEAISSLVGGLVLGVIALRTRSIAGGVLLHLGVAWSMEAAAFLQLFMRTAPR